MEQEETDRLHKEAADAETRALTAVTELIVATLREPDVTRFDEAGRLCEVAKSLTKARARRAADFAQQGGNGNGGNYQAAVAQAFNGHQQVYAVNNNVLVGGGVDVGGELVDLPGGGRARAPVVPPGRVLFDEQGNLVNEQGIVYMGNIDANALMRHMLMAFGPHAQTGAEANRARVAAEEAVELKALTGLLDGSVEPDRALLQSRIKKLMTNMQARAALPAPTEMKDEESVHVVPADDQRGHPADENRAQADEAPRIRPDGGGDAGYGEPPRARPLDPVGAVAVV